jgi:hypothetical protein
MWRRTYLFLVLVRLWFALSPSYLHPDENFQGPEVIAGMSRLSFACLLDRDQGRFPGCAPALTGRRNGSPIIARGLCARKEVADSEATQGRSSATQSGALGNLRATTRFEACSRYGPFTVCRCFCCGGCG